MEQKPAPGSTPEQNEAGNNKLPHDHDESSSAETRPDREDNARKGRQGAADIERGVTDTSRGAETQRTYDRHLRGSD